MRDKRDPLVARATALLRGAADIIEARAGVRRDATAVHQAIADLWTADYVLVDVSDRLSPADVPHLLALMKEGRAVASGDWAGDNALDALGYRALEWAARAVEMAPVVPDFAAAADPDAADIEAVAIDVDGAIEDDGFVTRPADLARGGLEV
jgi:hypothetical protein